YFACIFRFLLLSSFPTRRSSDLEDLPAASGAEDDRLGGDRLNLSGGELDGHDALTASIVDQQLRDEAFVVSADAAVLEAGLEERSEEHTSELQSRFDLVCRLLLE